MIELINVGKTYQIGRRKICVLRDINLNIDEGEFLAMLGPSGSGKSTLLNIIGGLQRPDAGRVEFDGAPLQAMSERRLSQYRRSCVGFVFQNFNLCPHLTALENTALPLLYAGLRRREREARARAALDLVSMGSRLEHRPGELSGGQCQRVAIARAIVCEPALILADEPTGNLDAESGGMVMELFSTLWRAGYAIVMVTHDERQAAQAQRTLIMRDGRLETQPPQKRAAFA